MIINPVCHNRSPCDLTERFLGQKDAKDPNTTTKGLVSPSAQINKSNSRIME